MTKLKWATHADLAIRKTPTVGRDEHLDFITFRRNEPLFTEIWGPIVDWDKLDLYRCRTIGRAFGAQA